MEIREVGVQYVKESSQICFSLFQVRSFAFQKEWLKVFKTSSLPGAVQIHKTWTSQNQTQEEQVSHPCWPKTCPTLASDNVSKTFPNWPFSLEIGAGGPARARARGC